MAKERKIYIYHERFDMKSCGNQTANLCMYSS